VSAIAGKRILVVEDEPLVAALLEEMLLDLGLCVVGPAYSVGKALELAERAALDGAVLDVNIRSKDVDPIADVLRSRGVPFVLATGYGAAAARARQVQVIEKPYTRDVLAAALTAMLGAGCDQQGPPPEDSPSHGESPTRTLAAENLSGQGGRQADGGPPR